jgi:competence protein ComEA
MGNRINWVWATIIVALVVLSLVGGALSWSRYDRGNTVELTMDPGPEARGMVYLGDGLAAPGFYPFRSDDTIGDLLQAGGGATADADLNNLRLSAASAGGTERSQRVDINRAEKWLLEALPGIGGTLAQRILDYRAQHGPFRSTAELTEVSGIGKDVYSKIRDLITVNGY